MSDWRDDALCRSRDEFVTWLTAVLAECWRVPRTAMSQRLQPCGERKVPSRDTGPGSALAADYRGSLTLDGTA